MAKRCFHFGGCLLWRQDSADLAVANTTIKAYSRSVLTIVETALFSRLWPDYWTEDERAEFAVYLAANPDVGDVIQGSGGCRKVRWARAGTGKSGGVRVIHFNRLARGDIVLLLIYAKSARDSIGADVLRKIVKEL